MAVVDVDDDSVRIELGGEVERLLCPREDCDVDEVAAIGCSYGNVIRWTEQVAIDEYAFHFRSRLRLVLVTEAREKLRLRVCWMMRWAMADSPRR